MKQIVILSILLSFSSCKSKDASIKPQIQNIVASESIMGSWKLKSTRPEFPSDTPKKPTETNEQYVFDTETLSFKRYLDTQLKEEGKFNISSEGKLSILFLNDKSKASLKFEGDMLILGNRIPIESTLIDYDDYHYYVRL